MTAADAVAIDVDGAPSASTAEEERTRIIKRRVANARDVLTRDVTQLPRDPLTACGQSSLGFRDLSFSIRSKELGEKLILAPSSGAYKAGSMVAIMVRPRSTARRRE